MRNNCLIFGNSIEPNICPDGFQFWNKMCLSKCPKGTIRVSENSCVSETVNKIKNCKGIKPKYCPTNMELWKGYCYPKFPKGTRRKNFYDFERKILKDCDRFGDPIVATKCPDGFKLWNRKCYINCPAGRERLDPCTCQAKTISDCSKFGNFTDPDNGCPNGFEYWGGYCYRQCPSGWERVNNCTCQHKTEKIFGQFPKRKSDCNLYGRNILPIKTCPEGKEYYRGMCLTKCPKNWKRIHNCVCESNKFPVNHCEKYGISIQPQCPSNRELWNGFCFKKCPEGYHRISDCECESNINVDYKNYTHKIYPLCNPLNLTHRQKYELWNDGLCYPKCSNNLIKTDKCTCVTGLQVNKKFINISPTCDHSREMWNGLCFIKCPKGYSRVGDCKCKPIK